MLIQVFMHSSCQNRSCAALSHVYLDAAVARHEEDLCLAEVGLENAAVYTF